MTASQEVAATLTPVAVTALHNLAQALEAANPIVTQHVQLIVQQQPAVIQETIRLGLTSRTNDGALHLTDAGRRLIWWLAHDWEGWAAYMRRLPLSVGSVWGWHITASPAIGHSETLGLKPFVRIRGTLRGQGRSARPLYSRISLDNMEGLGVWAKAGAVEVAHAAGVAYHRESGEHFGVVGQLTWGQP